MNTIRKSNDDVAIETTAHDITAAIADVDCMYDKIANAFCLATLLNDKLNLLLSDGNNHPQGAEFFCFIEEDRKVVEIATYQVRETMRDMDRMIDELREKLEQVGQPHSAVSQDIAGALSGHLATAAAALQRPCVPDNAQTVDSAIIAWRYAYDAWNEAVGDDDHKADTPEEAAEEEARKALISVPCKSLYDVQRKAELFSTHPYLSGLTADHADDLLRSFFSH